MIDERLLNRQKYVVESDTTSIDIPVNVASGEFVKITMIASGDNSIITSHGQPLYFKPNNLSNFDYKMVRTYSELSNSATSTTTTNVKIVAQTNSNRIIVGNFDNVYAYFEANFFLTSEKRFSFHITSSYASNSSSASSYQQIEDGYINVANPVSKIEKITIFTDSSTVKIPAGTTFIVEKF